MIRSYSKIIRDSSRLASFQRQRLLTTEGTTKNVNPNLRYAKTRAGTGNPDGVEKGVDGGAAGMSMIPRGPVSWPALGLVAVVAASAVSYYKIERERRMEEAMGKIVSIYYYLILNCPATVSSEIKVFFSSTFCISGFK